MGPCCSSPPGDCDSHDGPPQDSPGDGRAQLPGGGGGRVWPLSHGLHGGVQDGDGPRDDAQESLDCRNVTRYEEKCETIMRERMVEEKRPICKLEVMKTGKAGSKKVMRCKLGMKRMKKKYPKLDCKKVAAGQEEKCVDMVKLQEENHEVKKCSFHPK